jgi:hypothetical protein
MLNANSRILAMSEDRYGYRELKDCLRRLTVASAA